MATTKVLLFHAATGLSFLLCVASATLWALLGDAKETIALSRLEHPDTSTIGWHLRLAVALVPYWLVVVPTSLMPLLWLASYTLNWQERRRLHRLGTCSRCGYDVRATPDRCPECGTPAEGGDQSAA